MTFFRIIDSKLYITTDGMVEAGYKANNLKSLCGQGVKTLPFIKDPDNLKRTLFDYEGLGKKYREKILARWKDPYAEFVMQPIREMIKQDLSAEKFYMQYRFDNDPKKIIPVEHVRKYTRACEVLNMLAEITGNKKAIKTLLKISISEFWQRIGEMIQADRIYLPASYRRLTEKLHEYQGMNGPNYACIIDNKLYSNNAAKVNDEVAESTLIEMVACHQQWDDVMVSMQYNKWAKENARKTITPATVGNYRRKNKPVITMQREGRESYYNQFSKSIKGFRPTHPLYLLESDDNHLDFFFVDWENGTQAKYFNRFKAIVVTDSFNDYVLGYAYGRELKADVVRQAYRNAMYHIKELTGHWYLPRETKTDRWAISDLEPFYKSIGNYFKTPVGSKRRGYIEQFFGSIHWKRAAKFGTNNYTGNNITAGSEGINKEVLMANKNNWPTVQEAPAHIEDFFHRLRMSPEQNGKSKQENWLEAFMATPPAELRPITDEQFLLKFGITREEQNTITSRGLDISVNGLQYNYDIPDMFYFQWKGKQVSTIYDPRDMTRILVTDFDKLRFIATSPYYQPRALADYKTGDRIRLNEHLEAKKAHVALVTEKSEHRKEILQREGIDISALLTSGMVLKADRQKAELDYQVQQLTNGAEEPKRNIDIYDKM